MSREIKKPTNNLSDKAAAAVRAQQLNGEIKTHLIDDAIDALGGVYPGLDIGVDLGLLCVSLQSSCGYGTSSSMSMPLDGIICTRAKFESRKAERQNKPSWKDAPKWANWLAQNCSGLWWWYAGKDKPLEGRACFACRSEKCARNATQGEVIGNWQDTLEQRPEVKSDSQVTRRSYANERRAAFDKFAENVCSKLFGPEAYRNTKQLNELLSDAQTKPSLFEPWACLEIPAKADWYDYDNQVAVAFPPAGSSVLLTYDGASWSECEIKYISEQMTVMSALNNQEICVRTRNLRFRPLDWNRNQPKVESIQSPELSFHLATAQNELTSSAKLLPAESNLLQSITGVIAAIQAIREGV